VAVTISDVHPGLAADAAGLLPSTEPLQLIGPDGRSLRSALFQRMRPLPTNFLEL
jgi:hypothetical protein